MGIFASSLLDALEKSGIGFDRLRRIRLASHTCLSNKIGREEFQSEGSLPIRAHA